MGVGGFALEEVDSDGPHSVQEGVGDSQQLEGDVRDEADSPLRLVVGLEGGLGSEDDCDGQRHNN